MTGHPDHRSGPPSGGFSGFPAIIFVLAKQITLYVMNHRHPGEDQ